MAAKEDTESILSTAVYSP